MVVRDMIGMIHQIQDIIDTDIFTDSITFDLELNQQDKLNQFGLS